MLKHKVGTNSAGQRTDQEVTRRLGRFTRSSLTNLFKNHQVLVNGQPAKPAHKLHAGDELSIDDRLLNKQPEPLPLKVIYEDSDVVVIDKPAGILTHSKGALNLESTVADFLRPRLNDKRLSGNRAGIVHRLDRGTSGVMILAKHQAALKFLQKQFSTRKVEKTYLAIVEGKLKPVEAIIDVPLARNPKKPQTFRPDQAGKPAITRYAVLADFKKNHKDYSLVQLEPKTGRTHQLRVHLKYLGHPVVGDAIYGQAGPRLFLHAASLQLSLPNGHQHKFEVSLPQEFKNFTDD